MRYLIITSLLFIYSNLSMAQIKQIEDFKWENRVLVIYSNEYSTSLLDSQSEEIKSDLEEFKVRDLIVLILEDEIVKSLNLKKEQYLNYEQILERLNVNSEDGYQNILIGKDGGIKMRKDQPIKNEKLFATIDAMPMRKREMKDKN
ncbi:DUF4174 domain-containing protein [Marivirga arenosa]|nr:DUF4174 domain-containing protein [Marivirga sp. BKB1-2]